jgi:toxin CcdB
MNAKLTLLIRCFDIAEESLLMCTQFMAAVPANILKNPLASLSGRRDDIVAAIDLLMQGF